MAVTDLMSKFKKPIHQLVVIPILALVVLLAILSMGAVIVLDNKLAVVILRLGIMMDVAERLNKSARRMTVVTK
jgi:hypothetical protein